MKENLKAEHVYGLTNYVSSVSVCIEAPTVYVIGSAVRIDGNTVMASAEHEGPDCCVLENIATLPILIDEPETKSALTSLMLVPVME